MAKQELKPMKVLPRTEFGDPILRKVASRLTPEEIASDKIQTLIKDIRHTLVTKKFGVGLAAPQVGESLALSVIAIRPVKHRPNVEPFDLVIISPKIIKTFGTPKDKWEGCLSAGASGLFGKVGRYKKIEIKFLDEAGKEHVRQFEGLQAQVIQHETDHLNGILFVDHVTDPKTYMTLKEYKKQVVSKRKN